MNNREAKKRYFRIFVPAMTIYVVGFLGIAWFADNVYYDPFVIAALGLVPIAALLAMFWAHLRLISEIDEFLRSIQIKAVLGGLSVVFVIATGWGIVELLTDVPRLPIFWINPIYFVAYGLASILLTRRAMGQTA